ncbi:MAG TPA: family 78 glycoside hydrolase catalytic domain, partial [Thermomicrobiales bacterium]|nr:family 78 glycoside hydrolase catalytic domain [Thermomicrobiales bacterium]
LLMQLHIDYADGSSEIIATDAGWRATTGPIRYADLLMGEYYDARREMPGWNAPGFDDRDWSRVAVSSRSSVPLVSDPAQPVRALEAIAPLSRTEPAPGTFIFDLGQNIAGRASVRTTGPAGTTITLRLGEMLDADGALYTENLRGARATDTFVLAGAGEEVFEPRFTFHGFRYVEVSGYPGIPALDAIAGRFVGSDTLVAGGFTCSDELVNQLQRNIVWGQRGNFLSVPTDCPQRDERLGWLGDAQVFVATAIGNMDVSAFFTKWMRDVSDAQGWNGAFSNVAPRLADLDDAAPAWGDCGVILPWTIWQAYGDTRIIDEHWAAMAAWVAWIRDANPDLRWRHNRMHDYGDWLSIGADTPKELIGTAYFAYDAKLMAGMAEATGRDAEARYYRHLFDEIAAVFRDAYVRPDGTIEGDTQTVYCLALQFGLLTGDLEPVAARHLVERIADKNGHLSTGFVGVSYLCHVLTEHGYPDVAYRLLQNRTFPSWKYSILQGATTIWERWDGWTEDKGFQNPGMNSFNHYSLGSVGDWMRRSVSGIGQVPGTTGYASLRIRPQVNNELTFAEGQYDSIRGPVRSRWERSDDSLTLQVDVPANVTAEVWIPAEATDHVTEGQRDVAIREWHDATAIVDVGSGAWSFTVQQR